MTALIQKGYALTRMAAKTKTDEAWQAARRHFVSVNRIENDHPIPLIYYYLAFSNKTRSRTKQPSMGWNGRWNSRPMTPVYE